MGFPDGSVVKNPPANAGDGGLIPGSERSPGEGNGNPFQYSCLGNPTTTLNFAAAAAKSLQSCLHQAPLSMGFSRREYWSGLPYSSQGDLPDSGTEPGSPALQADALLSEPPGKPNNSK